MKQKLNRIFQKSFPQKGFATSQTNEPSEHVLDHVNEAVNFEKQAIFIAIPKTGTTSVRQQMSSRGKALIYDPHLNIVQVREAIYLYLLLKDLGNNAQFPSRDRKSDTDIRTASQEIFESFFKFSSVRNPWARAVSLYSRREGIEVREKLSFENFCEQHIYASDTCIHPTLHQNQLDWLTDETGEIVMDYVYKVEEFETAIANIRELTNGRIQLEFIKANKNPRSKSTSYRDLYSDRARQLIATRFEKDIDCFKYTF